MGLRVKICGITSVEDALVAVDADADALGFVFCDSSPRHIQVSTAARIIAELPPLVAKVGLFVNATAEYIREVVDTTGIDTLQLHGDESPEFCRAFRLKVIKAFRVKDLSSLESLPAYKIDACLLDAFVADKQGGTGETFNWELARVATRLSSRVILAGGLTPANVAEAVRQVRPYAVDVSSGVEAKPGRKDPQKLRDFIQSAKAAWISPDRNLTSKQ
jgi:phosphoribosylanthranilate isomerase